MATVRIDADCDDVVAHLSGVRAELLDTAERGADRAEAILAAHRHQGKTEIAVIPGDKLDFFVTLIDHSGPEDGGPAAAAIEFGRSGGKRGATQGVGALSGAF